MARIVPVLSFHEPFPAWTRLLVGVAGLACFWGPYDLLIRPGVPLFNWGMAPFWFIGLSAGALGLAVIATALMGLTRTVILDPEHEILQVSLGGAFGFARTWRHDFAAFEGIAVRRDDSPDGPPDFKLEAMRAKPEKAIIITSLKDEREAARLATALSHATGLARID